MAASGGTKQQKSQRRKISLPWFRQGSSAGPTLSRQHTIDTPSSFHKRLLSRQTTTQVAGGVEMTWVINDHLSTAAGQLSVTKGQQVEVVEVVTSNPDWCLVRMPSSGLDPPPEGLVPLSVLKQPPSASSTQSPRLHELDPGTSEGGAVTTNSPVNKRRVFSGRKWLPPPLRKLSSAKVEKTIAATNVAPVTTTPEKSLPKTTPLDKRFKAPADVKPTETAPEESKDTNGEEAEEEVELPPPMKPINESILVTDEQSNQRSSTLSLEGATSADLAEIEQIVKERMEQHSEKQSKLGSIVTPDQASTSSSEGESAIQKREYVIRELVETERDYVRDLKLVADGYMPMMRDPNCEVPIPDDLAGGKDKMVFGNLEAIYEWHKNVFLKALENCVDSPSELGPLFKRSERKLFMYVVYCQNKPVSEYIVSEFDTYFEELRQKLGHKLQLCDLLIKPVQRIMKYQLLLRDLYKYTERAKLVHETETLRQALVVMQVVPKAANDMMDVGRLQGFDGKITAQGKLLLHGPLMCQEGTSTSNIKGKELFVFLFEQNLIFSEAVGKKTQFTNPVYIYKAHIQVNKMSLDEGIPTCREKGSTSDDNEAFVVRSTDPRKPGPAYACLASNAESRAEWVFTLRNILQTQRDFLKAIQSPIAYQKELTKDPLFCLSVREPSPPDPYEQSTEVEVLEVMGRTRSSSSGRLLEGFRNTLRRARSDLPNHAALRRWSDVRLSK